MYHHYVLGATRTANINISPAGSVKCYMGGLPNENVTQLWTLVPQSILATKANGHLNFNFHCISSPNHPGKVYTHQKQANAPLNLNNAHLESVAF